MPVYKDDLDNIIGFVNIKDIFPYLVKPLEYSEFQIDKVIRKLLIISPSMKIFNLLEEMRSSRTHIALVVDEFGGTDGLITIEDLVEEIIGKMEDEYDQVEVDLKEVKPNVFEASGRMEISSLEEHFNVVLSEQDGEKYDTIGGLILSISGYVPKKGKKITHSLSGIVFEILESDPRRIKKVLITRENEK
jgi:CBS domain containing-hemolysin-like protein